MFIPHLQTGPNKETRTGLPQFYKSLPNIASHVKTSHSSTTDIIVGHKKLEKANDQYKTALRKLAEGGDFNTITPHIEAQGVIAQVTTPTKWISSMVAVPKKNGKLRICLDPRDLNHAIQRENYQIPTVEDIATRLHGAILPHLRTTVYPASVPSETAGPRRSQRQTKPPGWLKDSITP
ncbi:hypothetical protein ACROYT_G028701 [Oculina patagonica]